MVLYDGSVLKKMLKEADDGGFAIPMFNYTDLWDQLGVIEAAQELHAPIMFAAIPKTIAMFGIDALGALGVSRMKTSKVPVIHHLDHSNSAELCKQAIDHGFPSVMIDASRETLETNISVVKEVVDYAHPRNCLVEGEIGMIKGRDYESVYHGKGDDYLVQVSDAVMLVENTNVDALAVGIGTAHGFYQGKPELNFKRLAEVNEAVSIPLVLHGGTGIPSEDIKRAIKNGINKVNIGTQIRYTYMLNAHRRIEECGAATHTVDLLKDAKEAVKDVAKEWIITCMADGKA